MAIKDIFSLSSAQPEAIYLQHIRVRIYPSKKEDALFFQALEKHIFAYKPNYPQGKVCILFTDTTKDALFFKLLARYTAKEELGIAKLLFIHFDKQEKEFASVMLKNPHLTDDFSGYDFSMRYGKGVTDGSIDSFFWWLAAEGGIVVDTR